MESYQSLFLQVVMTAKSEYFSIAVYIWNGKLVGNRCCTEPVSDGPESTALSLTQQQGLKCTFEIVIHFSRTTADKSMPPI